jgi:LacI family transcriptional regulator
MLTIPNVHPTIPNRLAGVRRACEEAGLPLHEQQVVYRSEPSYAAGHAGARVLWEQSDPRPTGLLCLNDQVAIGALRAFQELNVAVPEEMAVIGFDNLPEGAFARVPLTTLSQPVEEEASRAVERLFERLARTVEPGDVLTISLPPTLVIRESCGATRQEREGSNPSD